MNNISKAYENYEIYKGLVVPEGDKLNSCSMSKMCVGLRCAQDCIFGNEEILKQYILSKERKEKIKCLNRAIK